MTADQPMIRAGPRDAHQWRLWLAGLVGSRYDGLTHFQVVQPGVLMRCGQPRLCDLEHIRREHGLRTVVCARGGTRHPLRGRWFRKEKDYCAQHGVRLEHMPFSDKAAPPEHLFDRFLELVEAETNHPLLVHCEQGFHRTGILCAAYRVRCSGWSLDEALAEMGRFGFELERKKRRLLVAALRQWAGGRVSPSRRG